MTMRILIGGNLCSTRKDIDLFRRGDAAGAIYALR